MATFEVEVSALGAVAANVGWVEERDPRGEDVGGEDIGGDLVRGSRTSTHPTKTQTWTATVDYDDGAGPVPLDLNLDQTFALNHQYAEAGTYTVTVSVTDGEGEVGTDTLEVTVEGLPEVVGRHVFYNNSTFDGNNPLPNAADDQAIAPDPAEASDPLLGKTALLPGGTATFQNYTSYSRGINGIMVDMAGLAGVPTAPDFSLKVGNSNDPAGWDDAPQPTSVTVRLGAGVDGSDRITLVWPDNAIEKQWLQVIIPAGGNLGLAEPDIFYFGNAIGESGNSTVLPGIGDAKVNAIDMLAARNNPHNFFNAAPLDDFVDFDRDQKVNATDMLIARNNTTNFFTALELIVVPPAAGDAVPGGKSLESRVESRELRVEGSGVPAVQSGLLTLDSGLWVGKLAWLYEFELRGREESMSETAKSAQRAVDRVFDFYWSETSGR